MAGTVIVPDRGRRATPGSASATRCVPRGGIPARRRAAQCPWLPRRGRRAGDPDGRLVARGEDVALVGGVAPFEQSLVVRTELGLPEHLVRPARASSTSSLAQTATGIEAMTRGAGLPAAALVMRGTTCSPMARSSAIHRIVPDACSPARRSMTGPSAASTTGLGTQSVTSIGLCTR